MNKLHVLDVNCALVPGFVHKDGFVFIVEYDKASNVLYVVQYDMVKMQSLARYDFATILGVTDRLLIVKKMESVDWYYGIDYVTKTVVISCKPDVRSLVAYKGDLFLSFNFDEATNTYLDFRLFDAVKNKYYWEQKLDIVEDSGKEMSSELIAGNYLFKNFKKLNTLYCFAIESGSLLWKFDVQTHYSDNTRQFRNNISRIDYFASGAIAIVRLTPYRIIAINVIGGSLLWKIETPMAIPNYTLDQELVMIYILDAVWDDLLNKRTVIYQIINGATGESVLQINMEDNLQLSDDKVLSATPFHIIGVHLDTLYVSDLLAGIIFAVNKFTGRVSETYRHEKPFLSVPVLTEGRLYAIENDDEKRRVLILGI